MPHTLIEIESGGDLKFVAEACGTPFSVAPADIPFPFELEEEYVPTGPFGPGASVAAVVGGTASISVGEFVFIKEGANEDYTSAESVVVAGDTTITLKTLANAYTVAARVYKVKVNYEALRLVDPSPSCDEITMLSLYGSYRDALAFRAVYAALTADEFDFMYNYLASEAPPGGTRAEDIEVLISQKLIGTKIHKLFAEEQGVSGVGTYDPSTTFEDGGSFVSHSFASFEDQFEDVSGTGITDEYIFEVPFDTYLTRASIHTNTSTDVDAYVTIWKNDVTPIVDEGPVPPNRNLPAVTGQLKGIDLNNIPVVQGDKITVRLHLVNANTLNRVKVLLGHAPKLKNL